MPISSGRFKSSSCAKDEDPIETRDLAKLPGYFLLINNSNEFANSSDINEILKPGFKNEEKFKSNNDEVDIIRRKLSEVTASYKKKHKSIGSIMVMVLARHDEDGRLWAKDKSYCSQEIISPFQKYEELESIPTIFLFLVCKSAAEISGDKNGNMNNISQVVPALKERNCLICVSEEKDFINNLNKEVESRRQGNELVNWTSLLSQVAATTSIHNHQRPVLMSSLQSEIIYRTKKFHFETTNDSYRFSAYQTAGLALIFNTYEFQQPRMFSRRDGSHQNVSSLLEMFQDMKFQVKTFNDLLAADIRKTIKQISSENLSQFGCLVVVVMTHSNKDKLQACDQPYDASEIWQPFLTNAGLVNKPKIFLFEANAELFSCMKKQPMLYQMKDVFIAFACLVSENPLRHLRTGNYFIQSFCEAVKFCKESTTDFLSLFILVSKYVQEKIENSARRQTPCFVSFLTKQFIFRDLENTESSSEDEYGDVSFAPQLVLPAVNYTSGRKISASIFIPIDNISNKNRKQSNCSKFGWSNDVSEPEKQLCMFGALREDEKVVREEIETKENFDSLLKKFDKKEENIKFIAGDLLNIIYEKDWDDKLEKVISHSPQEEILYFLWKIIIDSSTLKETLLRKTIELTTTDQVNFLHYYMDFSQGDEQINGFPLMCLLKSSMKDVPVKIDKLKNKIEILLELGANINDSYKYESEGNIEKSAVHFAAENQMKEIVDLLTEKGANINITHNTEDNDIVPTKEVTRTLQTSKTVKTNEENDIKSRLFQALHDKKEEEFLTLFKDNMNLIHIHDGKYTLLQLAIRNKLKNVASVLFETPEIDHLAMAGYCKEPILMALDNDNFELLELFLQATTKYDLRFCNNNSTFLHHLASKIDHKYKDESALAMFIQRAIEQRIYISALDKNQKSALEICVEKSNTLLKVMLDKGGFLNINEKIANKLKPTFLTEYLESKISIEGDKILKINYEFLKPIQRKEECKKCKKIAPEMVPFLELSKLEKFHKVLVESPLITFFLIHKWRQFAFVYLINFLMYFCFTVTFSNLVYCKLDCAKNSTNSSSLLEYYSNSENPCYSLFRAHLTSIIFSFIFWVIILLRELFQVSTNGYYYLKNFENYLEILILFFTFLTFITPASLTMIKELRFFAAIAITLIYIELTLLLGRHPSAELYITMFKQVSIKTLKLLFVFFSFFLAFAFSFHILLKNDDITKNQYFSGTWNSIMKTTLMAAGEFELDNMNFDTSPIGSKLLLITFLIFVVIVLMNLLNALAISDTQKIITEASVRCCIKKIKFFYELEQMFLGYSNDNSSKRCYGFDVDKENKEAAYLHKRTRILGKLFRAHDSPYRKKNYNLDIPLDTKTNFKIPKLTFVLHWFYKRLLLQIDERYTALEIQNHMKDEKNENLERVEQDNDKVMEYNGLQAINDENLHSKIDELQGEVGKLQDNIGNLEKMVKTEVQDLRKEMKLMRETLEIIRRSSVVSREEQNINTSISMDMDWD